MSLRQHRLQQAPGSRTEHHDRKLPLRQRAIGVDMIAAVLKRHRGLSLRELIVALDKEFGLEIHREQRYGPSVHEPDEIRRTPAHTTPESNR